MTAYSAIADSEIDPESPFTTSTATKYRDNPIAMFEKAVSAPVLANDYIVNVMVDKTIGSSGNQSIGAGATWTPSAGFYNIVGGIYIELEILISATWYTSTQTDGLVWFDGANMRIKNSDSVNQSVYWQKMT